MWLTMIIHVLFQIYTRSYFENVKYLDLSTHYFNVCRKLNFFYCRSHKDNKNSENISSVNFIE